MSGAQVFEFAASCFVLREFLLSLAELPRMDYSPLTTSFHWNPDVQHLVIDDVFYQIAW